MGLLAPLNLRLHQKNLLKQLIVKLFKVVNFVSVDLGLDLHLTLLGLQGRVLIGDRVLDDVLVSQISFELLVVVLELFSSLLLELERVL